MRINQNARVLLIFNIYTQAQQITNDSRLPTYQSQITPTEENSSYEY